MGNCCRTSGQDPGEASVSNILGQQETTKDVSALLALEEFINNQQLAKQKPSGGVGAGEEEIQDIVYRDRIESFDPQAAQTPVDQSQQPLMFGTQLSLKPTTPLGLPLELHLDLDKIVSDTQCDTDRNIQDLELQLLQKKLANCQNDSDKMMDSSYQKSNPHQYPNGRTYAIDSEDEKSNNYDMSAPTNGKKVQTIKS